MPLRHSILRFVTLMLSAVVISPPLPPLFNLSATVVQAQTPQNRTAEALQLYREGMQQLNRGQFREALETFEQVLVIVRELGDRSSEGRTLNNIGGVYDNLGEYQQALSYYQQALAIRRELGDRSGEGTTLNNIGGVYNNLGEYQQALSYFQQALVISREVGDRSGEGVTLHNMGAIYENLGEYQQALSYYQQALAISREVGDRSGEGVTLHNMGTVYNNLGEYQQALSYFQQALAIMREVGDRSGEGRALNNIASLLEAQNQPELAIVFFKQSVNVIEAIRRDIRGLPKEQQQSYTETVASTYRRLADLLLKQDRLLEAQRVLDLLKVQELEDYLHNVRGNVNTAKGLPNLPPEQQIEDSYQALVNQAIQVGQELTKLRQIQPENRTPAQEQRITQLVKAQEKIIADFNNFITSPEVEALIDQLSRTAKRQNLELEELIGLQDNLSSLQQNAVLLYPLILDDRLELILTTPDSPPIRRTVPVSKEQLNQAIVAFRRALQNPTSDAKTPAQQLYNWLIKPIAADLKTADTQTIIYAPDGQLRYIPLAALYDDQQWLVQSYRIHNITAASLTDFNTKPLYRSSAGTSLRVLAGAFASGYYSFNIGQQAFEFSGLPFAGVEVETLAETVPTTTQLIDKAFNPDATIPKMDDYNIVHFATHGAFVVGTPEESFILFGDGQPVTLRDVENWGLKNVDLIVLSACETGLGGQLGNGEEILGLGYQMQRAGARAAIASLWTVDDGGTQLLMNGFYAALQNSDRTKTEALRQAQISLITGNDTALGQQRGVVVLQRLRHGLKPEVSHRLSHPYYWAPFILIGNGL